MNHVTHETLSPFWNVLQFFNPLHLLELLIAWCYFYYFTYGMRLTLMVLQLQMYFILRPIRRIRHFGTFRFIRHPHWTCTPPPLDAYATPIGTIRHPYWNYTPPHWTYTPPHWTYTPPLLELYATPIGRICHLRWKC